MLEELGEAFSPAIAPLAIAEAERAANAAAVPRPRAVMPWSPGGAPKGSDSADSGDREGTCDAVVFEDFSGEGERSIEELYLSEELEWLEMDEEIDDDEPSPRWRTSP